MFKSNRRQFIKAAGLTGIAASMPLTSACASTGRSGKARVVVIGGGTGGATAARYIKWLDAGIDVTLIDASPTHHTCYFSNLVIGGLRSLESIEHRFDKLKARGVNVINQKATAIDTAKQTVTTADGKSHSYDRLIVSPGIDFRSNIEGYDAAASEIMPHAWKAGPQTALLRKQLEAMPNGGVVVLAPPPNPFRCPPGPYERASLIANYLKQHKPRSKVLIVDAKDKFSKQGLFMQGWKEHYGFGTDKALIEFVPAADTNGGIKRVDTKAMTAHTDFDAIKGAVFNIIPAQRAADIATQAGLTNDSGWCPVDRKTFESTIAKNVHVIGDASIATSMPKSGYSANSQAKATALAIVDLLNGRDPGAPSYINTCYSMLTADQAISVAAVYELGADGVIKAKSSGLTPMDASKAAKAREVEYANSWYNNLVSEIWG